MPDNLKTVERVRDPDLARFVGEQAARELPDSSAMGNNRTHALRLEPLKASRSVVCNPA